MNQTRILWLFVLGLTTLAIGQDKSKPRVLVTFKPIDEVKSILYSSETLEERGLKVAGLVLVEDEKYDLLIDRNLWLPPRLQNATATLIALSKMDASKPVTVRDMPKEAHSYLLQHIAGFARTQTGTALLGLDSEISISSNLSMVVKFQGKQVQLDWGESIEPKSNTGEEAKLPNETSPEAATPDSPKQLYQLYFPRQVSDTEFWRGFRAVSTQLEKRRSLLESQYLRAMARFARKFFKGKALILEKDVKGSLAKLPEHLQSQVLQRMRSANASANDVEIISASQNVYFSFKIGRTLISFTPKDLFDLP